MATKFAYKFATFMKAERKNIGLNQAQFAELIDTSQHTVSALEVGVRIPSLEMAEQILDKLGFDLVAVRRTEDA